MMDTLEQLRSLRQSIPPATPETFDIREQLLSEAQKLLLDLERPSDAVKRICYQITETTMVRTAIKMGLFEVINRTSSSTVDDLAHACNADVLFVGMSISKHEFVSTELNLVPGRVLRSLASYGAIKQTGVDSYGPATVSHAFVENGSVAAIEICFDVLARGFLALPSFVENKKWQNPTSSTDTSLAKGWHKPEGASFWEVLKNADMAKTFNTYMVSYNQDHRNWLDFYPVLERLGNDAAADSSAVMMVDVGGGQGHQALSFRQRFEHIPGKVIVQDLPQGLPAKQVPEIQYMEHDFFQEQPVRGARFYYLRHIIHDWSQELNIQICTQIRKAMKPGYSRLIIHDYILPDIGASRMMTGLDITIMNVLGGMERTLALHRDYLEKAGLKITKVYEPGDNTSESVIEAEPI